MLLGMNRALEAGFQLRLLHLSYSFPFLCSVSFSFPPLFISQPTTCVAVTITSMCSVCLTASSFWSLWTTKPSGLPLSSRGWCALQIMSPRVFICRICLCIANSFCVVSKAQAFFFSSLQLKLLSRLILHVAVMYLSYCNILYFCCWQIMLPSYLFGLLLSRLLSPSVSLSLSELYLSPCTVFSFSTVTNALLFPIPT